MSDSSNGEFWISELSMSGIEPSVLPIHRPWWDLGTKNLSWLAAFVPDGALKSLSGKLFQSPWGPLVAHQSASIIRKHIGRCYGQETVIDTDLLALYGLGWTTEFVDCLQKTGLSAKQLGQFVDSKDLMDLALTYKRYGYGHAAVFTAEDIRQFVRAWGEPESHVSPEMVFASIRHKAINRYGWNEWRLCNKRLMAAGEMSIGMTTWYDETFDTLMDTHLDVPSDFPYRSQPNISVCRDVIEQEHVVLDLETTGCHPDHSEIVRWSALRVSASGDIVESDSVTVLISQPIPKVLTLATGISPFLVEKHGVPLKLAWERLEKFASELPVVIAGASFDIPFLHVAAKSLGATPLHSTVDADPLFMQAWPELNTPSVPSLMAYLGLVGSTHDHMAEVKSVWQVLQAARAAHTMEQAT